jgi:hypothetical protein
MSKVTSSHLGISKTLSRIGEVSTISITMPKRYPLFSLLIRALIVPKQWMKLLMLLQKPKQWHQTARSHCIHHHTLEIKSNYQVVESLLSKHEALSSNSSPTKKKKKYC